MQTTEATYTHTLHTHTQCVSYGTMHSIYNDCRSRFYRSVYLNVSTQIKINTAIFFCRYFYRRFYLSLWSGEEEIVHLLLGTCSNSSDFILLNFRQLIHSEFVLNWLSSIKEVNMGNRNLVIAINVAVVLFVQISRISAQGQSSLIKVFFFWIVFYVTWINCETRHFRLLGSLFIGRRNGKVWPSHFERLMHHLC